MKHLLQLLLFLLCFSGYAQVNPNYHKVKGYYKKNGTYVAPHYRTNRNNTNRDNYSTKPNINPWTGKKGYVTPDTKTIPTYKSNTRKNQSTYYYNRRKTYKPKKQIKSEKPISTIYPTKGNAMTKMVAKLRPRATPFAEVITRIPKGAKIQTISKTGDYWKVNYDGRIGFLNEMYLSHLAKSSTKQTFSKRKSKSIERTFLSERNVEIKMIAKLRPTATPFSEVILSIPKGKFVKTIKKDGDYWKINYNGRIGYLNEMYLNLSTSNQSTVTKSKIKNFNSKKYFSKGKSKTKMIAKLRPSATPFANVIMIIPKGKLVKTIKKDGDYWKVDYNGKIGYLNEMYLEIQ